MPDNTEKARKVGYPLATYRYVRLILVAVVAALFASVTLTAKAAQGAPNFEGVRDTALDLINYASFLVERTDRERGGLT